MWIVETDPLISAKTEAIRGVLSASVLATWIMATRIRTTRIGTPSIIAYLFSVSIVFKGGLIR